MSGNFQHTWGNIFCEFDVKRGTPIYPQHSAGLYALSIPITFDVKTSETPKILTSVSGAIYLNSQFVTELKPQDGNFTIQQSEKHALQSQQNFSAIFQKSTIDAIEAVRASGELSFEFKLYGSIIYFNDNSGLPFNIHTTSGYWTHRMLQAEWVDILNKWKYAPAMSFDLVLKFENPSFIKAADFIYQAQKFYMERHWPQAILECRKAIDAVSDAVNPNKLSLKDFVDNRRNNNMSGRLTLSILAIKQICDVAGHGDSNATQINWTQEDALYAIRMTASILMRASKEVT